MKISFLTVVTFLNVLVSAFAESTFIRGGLTNRNKDANNHPRSLALLSECNDSEEFLYKDKTCDWIAAINNKKKMKNKCNKKTKLGMIYDLCPSTCSGVDLGRCTTFKLEETIESLRATIRDLEVPITDEDVTLNSVIFKDMKAEKEALEAALAGCTPEAVCDEKVRVAIEAATATSTPSNCTAINAEKVAVLEEQKLEKDIKIASLTGTIESVSKNLAEKDGEIEEKDTIISGHEDEKDAITAEKDEEIADLEDAVRKTVAEKALLLDLAEKDQEDLADLRLTILELKKTVTTVSAEKALLLEQLASDKVRQEIEEEEEEEFEKDEATNFVTNFFDNINQLRIDSAVPLTSTFNNRDQLVVDTAVPLTSTGKCSNGGSAGGDCSQNPTYCSSVGILDGMKASLSNEIERIESDIKIIESEKAYVEQLQGEGPDSDNNIVSCSSRGGYGGYGGYGSGPGQDSNLLLGGGCSGTNSCLNLDFVCSPSADCEISCTGGNSCNGLTLYCAENQNCAITTCGDRTERCFGAEVVYVPTDCSVNDATFTYNEYTWQKGIGVCNL